MILQALKDYYDRKAADPESQMARPAGNGKRSHSSWCWTNRALPLASIIPSKAREDQTHQTIPRPKKRQTSPAESPPIFYGTISSTSLGVVPQAANQTALPATRRLQKPNYRARRHLRHRASAPSRYSSRIPTRRIAPIVWCNMEATLEEGANLAFQITGETSSYPNAPQSKRRFKPAFSAESGDQSFCLVTGGEKTTLSACTRPSKAFGVRRPAGPTSFRSTQRPFPPTANQGENAPIGKIAAFAYTEALNHLLGKDSKQRLQVGDASTVFWSDKATDFEQHVIDFFGEPPKDDPDRNVACSRKFIQIASHRSLARGRSPNPLLRTRIGSQCLTHLHPFLDGGYNRRDVRQTPSTLR